MAGCVYGMVCLLAGVLNAFAEHTGLVCEGFGIEPSLGQFSCYIQDKQNIGGLHTDRPENQPLTIFLRGNSQAISQ